MPTRATLIVIMRKLRQAMLQVFNLIIDVITSLDKDKLDLECEAEDYETGDTKSYRLVFTLTDPERPERVKNDT